MNIKTSNGVSFKALSVDPATRQLQKSINRPPRLKQDLAYVSRLIRERNLHKNENFDLLLKYTEQDGFVTQLLKKDDSINCVNDTCKIYPNKELNAQFYEWAEELSAMFKK
ncbi:MAG: hypothetical protein E7Z87_00820 [Cyanobacteria bacterium SIG26]|nr:hypothetical protein [Cyanobacteria bacterium SIG26]